MNRYEHLKSANLDEVAKFIANVYLSGMYEGEGRSKEMERWIKENFELCRKSCIDYLLEERK